MRKEIKKEQRSRKVLVRQNCQSSIQKKRQKKGDRLAKHLWKVTEDMDSKKECEIFNKKDIINYLTDKLYAYESNTRPMTT